MYHSSAQQWFSWACQNWQKNVAVGKTTIAKYERWFNSWKKMYPYELRKIDFRLTLF